MLEHSSVPGHLRIYRWGRSSIGPMELCDWLEVLISEV
jgi:hypothetical protein